MPPHMSQTPTDLIEGRERIKKKRRNCSNTKRGEVFSSWHTWETSWRLWNGSRPRPTRSRSRSSSVARPRTWAWKTERGKKRDTKEFVLLPYARHFQGGIASGSCCVSAVVERNRAVGAMEAQRSLIHAHLLSLCPRATPEPASNSMWRQSREIIRAPWFDKWGGESTNGVGSGSSAWFWIHTA